MQDDTLVVLAEYNTITEAEITKSMLDSAGIWSMIRNEYMSAIYPIGTMPAQVVVREEDFEKARATGKGIKKRLHVCGEAFLYDRIAPEPSAAPKTGF